jgi:choline kinase
MPAVEAVVIAAAGVGSRLGLGMPKCMIEIDGKTVLSRMIEVLAPHVPTVHLVVGYREEMVIDHCARYHRDVVIVRNPDYRTTNTAYSHSRGAHHLRGKVLYLDGDLVFSPRSIKAFINRASDVDVLVGITSAKSENAVMVDSKVDGDDLIIRGFSREVRGEYEWANVVSGPSDLLAGATGYVFERLAERLPLHGQVLDLSEIDTASDLNATRDFIARL